MTESEAGPTTLESLELVRRAQGGDLDAYDRLFERYYDRVLRIVRIRMGTLRNAFESSDLLHDALVRALHAFDEFEVRDEAGLIHWLAQIVENTIRMAVRREHAVKRDRACERALAHVRDSLSSGKLHFEPAVRAPAPYEELAEHEEMERLEVCLAELGGTKRDIVLARNYAGATWERAAEIVGSPSPGAARMLYGRALLELRERLERGR